ncbi:MAG: hypothetical protein R3B84_12490 [Zavarzinella sp.]
MGFPSTTTGIVEMSIHEEAFNQANSYRWIRSQEAKSDQGERAIQDWIHYHWRGFLRSRWVEHLEGIRFWQELDKNDFGLIHRDLDVPRDLLQDIIDQIKLGGENLGIIAWASQFQRDMPTVKRILGMLDINSRRLRCQFHKGDNC